MKKLTTEEYKKRIEEINKDIEIISEYTGIHDIITARCKIDGNVWKTEARVLYRSGCPKCDITKRTKTTEQFKKEVGRVNPNIEVLGNYKTSRNKLKFRCKLDGTIWETMPYTILGGCGCPKCADIKRINKKRKDIDIIKKQIKENNKDIELVGEYKNALSKTKFKCNKCGTTWNTSVSSIINLKTGCPKCSNRSKGEREIRKYCKENNIQYKEQYKIKKCKNIHELPFDFAIFNKEKLIALIEYQGVQHYKPVDFFGGEREFNKRKINDKIKKEYCKKNNILLIEIPYWVKRIDKYIEKYLKFDIQLKLTI